MNLTLTAAAASALLASHAIAQVVIVDRESACINNYLVTSGTASDSSEASDSDTTNLTGAFSFRNTGTASVGVSAPGSNGTVLAAGGHNMDDDVVQDVSTSLVVNAYRQSATFANVIVGTGQGEFAQNSVSRVRFDVGGADVFYFVVGEFNPDPAATAAVTIENTSTPGVLVNLTAAAVANETGTLAAGETYEFEVRVDNEGMTTPGNTLVMTENAYTLRLTVLPMDCRADLDGSGVIDFPDLNYMLSVFGSQDVLADIDGAGLVNFSDLNALLQNFGTACP